MSNNFWKWEYYVTLNNNSLGIQMYFKFKNTRTDKNKVPEYKVCIWNPLVFFTDTRESF